MSTVTRRHHTVPRFYLNKFAANDRIGSVRLPGDSRSVQSTRDTTVVKSFYLVDGLDEAPDSFEKVLSELESSAARVFGKILVDKAWPLAPADRTILATFVAVQNLRGPNQRNHLGQMSTMMTRLDIAAHGRENTQQYAKERFGAVLTDSEAEALWGFATQPDSPPIKVPALAHIGQIANLAPKTLNYFLGRPWMLFRFERKRLVTCDTPVSLIPAPDRSPHEGTGLANAWGITFPLSRTVGLLMGNPIPLIEGGMPFAKVAAGEFDMTAPPSAQAARMFNTASVGNARRFVLHHPDDADLVPQVLPEPWDEEIVTSGAESLIETVQVINQNLRSKREAVSVPEV